MDGDMIEVLPDYINVLAYRHPAMEMHSCTPCLGVFLRVFRQAFSTPLRPTLRNLAVPA